MSNKDKKFEVPRELIGYSIRPNDHFAPPEDGGLESTTVFGGMKDGTVVPVPAIPPLTANCGFQGQHRRESTTEVPGVTSPAVEPYVDSGKASAFLGVSSRTLNEMARTGAVPAYVWGTGSQRRTWRFKLTELDAYMKTRVGSQSRPPLPNRRRG